MEVQGRFKRTEKLGRTNAIMQKEFRYERDRDRDRTAICELEGNGRMGF